MSTPASTEKMEKIVALAKRRGFVFPGSEIYGGIGSTFDYGPLGSQLKKNIRDAWWKAMTQERDDVVGLDAAILMHPKTWEASGHLAGFSDPMVDCKKCKKRFRADHLLEAEEAKGEKMGTLREKPLEIVDLKCPACGGDFTDVRQFNMMMKTFLGPVEDTSATVYLRPETAQGIFVNFKNVVDTARKRIPFGIAQTGKSFRNEITPGNFIFRTREFEQLEMEYFVKPGTDEEAFEVWKEFMMTWFTRYGVKAEKLRYLEHAKEKLSHYSKRTVDLEYEYPWGWGELWGCANRTDFDLKQHAKFSGENLEYRDDLTNEKFVPYVIEPALGLDRAMLVFMLDAYEEIDGGRGEDAEKASEVETVLRFHPAIAPVKAAVFPLAKKEPIQGIAKDLRAKLAKRWQVQYDESGSVGRRYRRQDEIGTPFCITVDFETPVDGKVTVRDRDTMAQERIALEEIETYLAAKLGC